MLGTHVHHLMALARGTGHFVTMVVMVGLAWLVQVVIFRHLVNQEPIICLWRPLALPTLWKGLAI